MTSYCWICFSLAEDECVCDMCEQHYCDDCSYLFTLHYQHQGARCHICSDQTRIKKLTKDYIRENKIKMIFDEL